MGGGNSSKTTQQNFSTQGPWGVQTPYLSQAFNTAQEVYNQGANNPYQGNFVAQPQGNQTGYFNNLMNSLGGNLGNSTTAGDVGTGAARMGLNGASGAQSGLYGLASGDPTGRNISAAGAYANNPYMSSMIDASLTDARRNLSDVQLPAIDRDAASSGNINSSRAGIASGVAQRGFENTAANVAANMRGNAYEQGIGQSQQDTANRVGAYGQMGNLGNSSMFNGLYGLANSSNMLNTDANSGNLTSQNISANNQAPLNNAIQSNNYRNTFPWQQLQNFYNIIGGNNWGSTGSSMGSGTQQQNPSMLSSAGSIAGILGSLFG